jgi:hypothetical protein
MSPGRRFAGGDADPAALLYAVVKSPWAAAATASAECSAPVSVPGGNPTIAVPGDTPIFPLTLVPPGTLVLVTVEPARIPKEQAVAPIGKGPGHAIGVKVHTKLAANATPKLLCAPVVIVAVYCVPTVSGLDGVKVKTVFVELAVIVPDTPGVTVKVVALIVAGFIVVLKVAVIRVVGQAVVEASAGRTETTAGVVHATGVKVHTKLAANATPNWLSAPVVIVAVYIVPATRGLDGVKVKIVFVGSAVIGPDTPGVTVKVVALIVAGFIALLNVTLTAVLEQAVVEPASGTTESTVGGLRGEVAPPALSESLHPAITMAIAAANRNAGIKFFRFFKLRISFSSLHTYKAFPASSRDTGNIRTWKFSVCSKLHSATETP